MRLLFIRHGDPDYEHDTLTETGRREADALARHIREWDIDEVYISPFGRARDTSLPSLDALGLDRETTIKDRTRDWIREFHALVDMPAHPEYLEAFPNSVLPDGSLRERICWDIVPAYLNRHPGYFESSGWRDMEIVRTSHIAEEYDRVCTNFDALLAEYGYVREGTGYRVEKEYTGTIAFFCHFGVTCVILSHFMNISPYALWHGVTLAPTSVTEVFSEEREQGYALFRAWKMGDVRHLYAEGMEPSFSARFCEVYSNAEQRH